MPLYYRSYVYIISQKRVNNEIICMKYNYKLIVNFLHGYDKLENHTIVKITYLSLPN